MHAGILQFELVCDRAAGLLRSPSCRGMPELPENVEFSPHVAASSSGSIGLETDTIDTLLPMPDSCIPRDLRVDVCRSVAMSCRQGIEMYPLIHRSGIYPDKTQVGCRVVVERLPDCFQRLDHSDGFLVRPSLRYWRFSWCSHHRRAPVRAFRPYCP